MSRPPCPSHVGEGVRVKYCDMGDKDHWGTCVGSKPQYQYLRELEEYRKRRVRNSYSPS